MKCYRLQPQANSHVYRSVLLSSRRRRTSGSSDSSKNGASGSSSPVNMDAEKDRERCEYSLHLLGIELCLNPFTLRATKTGLTTFEIFYLQKLFQENIWRRHVDQIPHNNPRSNILWNFALFPSYFQKYESSRRYFLGELWVWMG